MATNVIMPQLGESVVEGTISRWLVKEGDTVEKYAVLMEVSTDKVDTEVPAPAEGVVLKLYYPEGETLHAGTVIAVIGQPGEIAPEQPGKVDLHAAAQHEPDPMQAAAPVEPARAAAPVQETSGSDIGRISPVVSRIAARAQRRPAPGDRQRSRRSHHQEGCAGLCGDACQPAC